MTRSGLDMTLLDGIILDLARQKALDRKYRDHELSGEWRGYRELHVKPDWMLIYRIEQDILLLSLARSGTHAQLFGK